MSRDESAAACAFRTVPLRKPSVARLPNAPSQFGAIGRPAAFRIRLRNVVLPDVSLVTDASSPKATDHCSRRLAIVIPFGDCASVLRAGRQEFHWAAPHHAFLVPAGQTIAAESTTGSFLRLDIVTAALGTAPPGTTVAEVGVACGLPRMATLVPHYVRRFGELPSETLRRAGR